MGEFADKDVPPTEVETPESKGEQQVPKEKQEPQEGAKGVHSSFNTSSFKLLMNYSQVGLRWTRHLIHDICQILAELHMHTLIGELKTFLSKHPFVALILAMITFSCGIPILIFVAFAITTLILTFGGLLIIEGAVLAAGSFALLLCLCTMVIVFITLGFIGGLLYVTYMQIDSIVRINTASAASMNPHDVRLPEILANLRNLPQSNHRHTKVSQSTTASHATVGHVHLHHSK